jgi:SAM-dependent methyltransferase
MSSGLIVYRLWNILLRENGIQGRRIKTWTSSYIVNSVWGRRIPHVYLQRFNLLCKQRKVKQIIDAGCGSGLYAAYFSLQGFEVTAMDISRTGLTLTRHLARSLHFLKLTGAIDEEPSKIDIINGELPYFPVAPGTAQAIFVNYTLHQLTHKELIACMAEFRRILKDRGVILIHEPCEDKLVPPNGTVEVLEDGSWFLKKYGLVNWNLTRDQLSRLMSNNFNVLTEERLEENGKLKVVFILEKLTSRLRQTSMAKPIISKR